ncbi:MAG: aminotransferase class I/II-fold pyridoxal phosphate-dependent enzyme [Pirellulales bacterium]
MTHRWFSARVAAFDSSGIRKVFDLASKLDDPINLSIGQPDFDVPDEIKQAAIDAIRTGKNGYSLTQGMPVLLDPLQAHVDASLGHDDRKVFVTSGTSGGLVLAIMTLVNPGDEVIVFDPYFVMYPALVALAGGKCVYVDTYPDFRVDIERLRDAITPRTKVILLNSPANPTGVVATPAETRAVAELAAERDIALISDEIYREFCHEPFASAAEFNDQTIVIEGFSKTYAMTGWRVGYAHGPTEVIEAMTRMQQYSFVCAPQPLQWGAAAADRVDMSGHVAEYRQKRDLFVGGINDLYDVVTPGGAFYAFVGAPWGTATEFVAEAIANNLLIIPGKVFSHRDTHFRVSYAASDQTIRRGIDVLRRLHSDGN